MGYDRVLLIGAETLSRIIDPLDRTTTVIFGDGAGAAVLAPTRETPGMLAWDLGCDGSAAALLEVPAGGSRLPDERGDRRQRRPLPEDGGARGLPPGGPRRRGIGDRHPRPRGREARATSRGSCRTRPTCASSTRLRIVSASRPTARSSTSIGTATRRRRRSRSRCSKPSTTAACRTATSCCCSGFGAGMTWASTLLRWGAQ